MSAIAKSEAVRAALPEGLADQVLSPALLVVLDAVRHNIDTVLDRLGSEPDRWRPHLKTTKLPVVWKELIAAGIRSFKCATTREAAVLIDHARQRGLHDLDLLVAYPHRGPNLDRVRRLAAESHEVQLSVLCEDPNLAEEASHSLGMEAGDARRPAGESRRGRPRAGHSLGIFIDLNPGMNRTGVPLEDRDTIEHIARLASRAVHTGGRPGIAGAAENRFRGLHFYDGHIRTADAAARAEQVHAGLARLVELVEWLRSRGIEVPEVITSGTPGFLEAASFQSLSEVTRHRVSPGTVVFHDEMTRELLPDLDLQPAAMVLARVVSHPVDDIVTCDAGSKSIAAEAGDPCCRVLDHPELTALKPSEEHLPLRIAPGAKAPARGEALLLIPRHVCPTVNLADEAIIIENGEVRSIEPVAARGHEVSLDSAG